MLFVADLALALVVVAMWYALDRKLARVLDVVAAKHAESRAACRAAADERQEVAVHHVMDTAARDAASMEAIQTVAWVEAERARVATQVAADAVAGARVATLQGKLDQAEAAVEAVAAGPVRVIVTNSPANPVNVQETPVEPPASPG